MHAFIRKHKAHSRRLNATHRGSGMCVNCNSSMIYATLKWFEMSLSFVKPWQWSRTVRLTIVSFNATYHLAAVWLRSPRGIEAFIERARSTFWKDRGECKELSAADSSIYRHFSLQRSCVHQRTDHRVLHLRQPNVPRTALTLNKPHRKPDGPKRRSIDRNTFPYYGLAMGSSFHFHYASASILLFLLIHLCHLFKCTYVVEDVRRRCFQRLNRKIWFRLFPAWFQYSLKIAFQHEMENIFNQENECKRETRWQYVVYITFFFLWKITYFTRRSCKTFKVSFFIVIIIMIRITLFEESKKKKKYIYSRGK